MHTLNDASRFLQAIFPNYLTSAIFANLNPANHTRDYTALDTGRDCYWSIAAFPDDGMAVRNKVRALEVRALVIDDVGTKVSIAAVDLMLGPPTAIVETSAGNFQYVYRLPAPVSVDQFGALFDAAQAKVGEKFDPNTRDAVHLFRLPMGVNTKPDRGGFRVRLVHLDPRRELSGVEPAAVMPSAPGPSKAGKGTPKLSVEDFKELLDLIPNVNLDRKVWVDIGQRSRARLEKADWPAGGDVFLDWTVNDPDWGSRANDTEGYVRKKWNGFDATETAGLELDQMARAANPEGYRAWKHRVAKRAFDAVDPAEVAAAAALGVEFSVDQEKSSIAVVEHLAGRLKKVGRGSWREFDEETGRWREWTDDHMLRRVLEMVRARKARPMAPAISKKLEGIRFIAGIAQAASLHRTVIAKVTDFDQSPLILGVPSGVIELGKGKSRAVRKGRASEMVSKAMWVDPAPPGTPHPEWSRFLAEFTEQDAGLEEWLQVHAGYCLTGLMEQHILPYFHGSGGNGKSVYLNALRSVWGEYATQMDHRLLFEKQGGYHLSPLAVLAGVRLAVVTDVPADAVWDVHIMKMLTGDDAITANRMHQDPITFKSSAKIAVSGNTEPVVKDMDEGIRRRLKSLPLTATPAVQDIRLSQKLAAEWGAILNWALTGLDMYWALGDLPVSKTVEDATTAYHTLLDPLQRWLDTGLARDPLPGAKVSAKDLYQSWMDFKAAEGRYNMKPNSSIQLARKMGEKKFIFGTTDGRSYLRGYRLTNSRAADVF